MERTISGMMGKAPLLTTGEHLRQRMLTLTGQKTILNIVIKI